MNRRRFLCQSFSSLLASQLAAKDSEGKCDVLVIGGGVGGFAAALAACRNGMRVILTEETDWIGDWFRWEVPG